MLTVNHSVDMVGDNVFEPGAVPSLPVPGAREGGLLLEHAAVRIVQDHQRLMEEEERWAASYPVPVWVLGNGEAVRTGFPLENWVRRVPEWEMAAEDSPVPVAMKEGEVPVRVFRTGTQVHAGRAEAPLLTLWVDAPLENLEILDGSSGEFQPLPAGVGESGAYDRFSRAWSAYRNRLGNRDLSLRDVVRVSRETGVLLPDTAYIVLENEAQEKMIKLKERQKLMGPDALDFMDTPEPGDALLLLTALLLAFFHRRSLAKRQAGHQVSCPPS